MSSRIPGAVDALDMLRGRRVLVTGGGFIGSRLAERLAVSYGAEVRVLVHRPQGAARLRHFPCQVIVGDVTDRAAVEAAVAGCDSVFHCAYGTSGSSRHRRFVNQEGTRRVLTAAGVTSVRRVVHMSTFMVYDRTPDGDLTEEAPRRPIGDLYTDSKIIAERVALDMARRGRAPVVVLQPTNVYGPYGGVWVEHVLAKLRTGRIVLVDGGTGVCNHVYVDDVVSAALLAAVTKGVVGEAFLVSSDEPVSWREFYARFETMLGVQRTVAMSADEARAHWRRVLAAQPRLHAELAEALRRGSVQRGRLLRTREVRAARRLASTLLPDRLQKRLKDQLAIPANAGAVTDPPDSVEELPIHPLSPPEIDFYASHARVRIEKARRLIGYRPVGDLAAGMASTEDWARGAGLLVGSRPSGVDAPQHE